MDKLVAMLRAAGDPTRLRLLLLLREAELTVSELIEIVGQSQPRVSRHLKLLGEAGLLERFKEGSWVFYRAADRGKGAELGRGHGGPGRSGLSQKPTRRGWPMCAKPAPPRAAAYFKANAAEWERIRALHAPEKDVEAAIVAPADRAAESRICWMPAPAPAACWNCWRPMPRAPWAWMSVRKCWRSRATGCCARNLHNAQVRLADIYRLPFTSGVRTRVSTRCCSIRCCIIWTIPARRWRKRRG